MPQPTYSTSETDAAIAALDKRVAALETNVTSLLGRVTTLEIAKPDPTPVPPVTNALFDANFAKGGNVSGPASGHILVNGKPAWRIYGAGYNDTYGMGTGGKIQSWNNPANVRLTDAGLELTGKMESGFNLPASAAFLGTRDTSGANAATQFPVPLYGTFTVDYTADGYVEDFDSVWLRHAQGSSTGEIDFFETVAAELTGENGLQFGVPALAIGGSGNLYRARYKVPVKTRVKLVMVIKPINTTQASITVTQNALPPFQTVGPSGAWDNPTVLSYVYNRGALEAATPDQAHAWDIAIQKHEGMQWGADVTKPYTGTLRNGAAGKPLGGATKSWAENAKTSKLIVHRITVEPV